MNFLRKIAPFLSTGLSLAGPYGAMAAKLLSPVLNVKDGKPEDLAAAISAAAPNLTGDQIEAIKQAEQQFQLQLKQLDIQSVEEMERMSNEDRASARNREIQVKDRMPSILGVLAVTCLILGFCLLAFHEPPTGTKEVVILLVGAFGRDAGSVYDYYFGSSKGSDDKTKVISDIAKS